MSHAGACPVCGRRKAKRACPVKGSICSVCCGTHRLVEIDCPPDCEYLTGAHAPSWDGRESDRRADLSRVAPVLERLSQDEAALFFYLLAGIVQISAKHRDADDTQWREALIALGKTLETRERGLVYEHAAEGLRAQELMRAMKDVVRPPEADGPVAPDRELLAALRALVASLDVTIAEGGAPKAFLGTAARLTARLVERGPRPEAPPSSKIIEP